MCDDSHSSGCFIIFWQFSTGQQNLVESHPQVRRNVQAVLLPRRTLRLLAVAATDSAETYRDNRRTQVHLLGPKHLASRAEYEVATHKTAVELLKERLGEDGLAALLQPDVNGSEPIWNAVFAANSTATPDGWLMTEGDVQAVAALPDLNGTAPAYDHETLKTAVALAKEHIGEEKLMLLLQPDILAADAIWHEVIANSTPGSWVPADGRAVCLLPNVTALGFALWSASPLCDAANNAANAEHYVKRTVEIGGWGGVTTLFAIPVYSTPPDRAAHPFLRALPEFPYQGRATGLRDGAGAVFGVLHIAIRDIDGADYGETGSGIEIFASVWYGDGANDEFLERSASIW
ncbi:hypothetical protein B0H13DRAFT_2482910 [Mycena leptocephala]|nr:hypothetical protein B0H13DRAFT_2482910 [Mycena leptocephala]